MMVSGLRIWLLSLSWPSRRGVDIVKVQKSLHRICMTDPAGDGDSRLTIVNASAEIERASEWLGALSAAAGLSKDVAGRLQVALDEVVTNIITHALADAPEGARQIWLCLRIRPDRVELDVADDGPAFDPTVVQPISVATRVAKQQEGGVGLLFVRALMDDVTFARHGGRNYLTLSKRLE